MGNWQVTAVTVKCPCIEDEATIIVNADWTAKCTGMLKYTNDRNASLQLVKRSMEYRRVLDCKGVSCPTISTYIEKLKNEEAAQSNPPGDKN